MRSTFAVRETQSLGQQMLNTLLGINGLINEKNLTGKSRENILLRGFCLIALRQLFFELLTFIFDNFFLCHFSVDDYYFWKKKHLFSVPLPRYSLWWQAANTIANQISQLSTITMTIFNAYFRIRKSVHTDKSVSESCWIKQNFDHLLSERLRLSA